MLKDLKNEKIDMHPHTFIAESADIIGDVYAGEGSSFWYGAVVRGDMSPIKIGKYSNVQDNATIHGDPKFPCEIGDYTTIGHNVVIHGSIIGDNCLIGIGSIILNGAKIGDNSIIAAGSLITEGTEIPENSLVMGSPGKVRRKLNEEDIKNIRNNANEYEKLWKEKYK